MKKLTKSARFITRSSTVGAIYVALTFISAVLGLSGGVIQLRLSESLCLLPIIMPEAVAGLTVGCIISNILTGCAVWDIVFGSMATLISAIITRAMRNYFVKFPVFGTLPTILANSIILPFVLMFVYLENGGYLFILCSVFIGEFISAGILGYFVYKRLSSSAAMNKLL